MEATMNFLEFNELKIGEKFIIIHTGDRNEREKLKAKKQILVKTAKAYRDNNPSRRANAVQLSNNEPSLVAYKTPVIRIDV